MIRNLTKSLFRKPLSRTNPSMLFCNITITNKQQNYKNTISKSYKHKHKQLVYTQSYLFCNNNSANFVLSQLKQVSKGYEYLNKNKYDLAFLQFSSALDFLPKNQPSAKCNYKKQYGNLLKNLLLCQQLSGKNISSLKARFDVVYKVKRLFHQLVTYQSAQKNQKMQEYYLKMEMGNNQFWKLILKSSFLLQNQNLKNFDINFSEAGKITDSKAKLLYFYLLIKHGKQLPMKEIQKNVLQLVSFGKQSDLQNISIYLLVTSQFFLKNQQFLMAEGLLNNICSQKQQKVERKFLIYDQEYIAAKVLLGQVYIKVNRNNEAQKLIDEFAPIYSRRKFFIQQILKISYENI